MTESAQSDTITMMKEKNIMSPSAGGVSPNNPPSLRCFPYAEYLCEDYCFSCAYFETLKGHFGVCVEDYKRGIYDGTKKGSACAGWRMKSKWLGIPYCTENQTLLSRKPVRESGASKSIFYGLGSAPVVGLPAATRLAKVRRMTHDFKVSHSRAQIGRLIEMVKRGTSVSEAAKKSGLSKAQAYRWCRTNGIKFLSNSQKEYCPQGHPLTLGNLAVNRLKRGRRICLICLRKSGRDYYHAHKELFRQKNVRYRNKQRLNIFAGKST